ncbi:MAG: hypothetical protein PHF63_02380 [Herbinix sp.]|nr:hypothetical protein [Herbinix sp.]
MQNNNNQNTNSPRVSDTSERDLRSEGKNTSGNTKDYISGDSTPSSSSHQFPRIATDPLHESKKSAMKTNK